MNYVVFIGDKPGKKNVSEDVAFVGTKSYSRLLTWIDKMNLSINQVQLVNKGDIWKIDSWKDCVDYETKFGYFVADRIVALGNEAEKFCIANELEYFKLPHPSGKNFKLNDKKYVDTVLKQCEQYIKEG